MRRALTLTSALAALVLAGSAHAGGPFANTINAPPADLSAGETWIAKVQAIDCFGSPADTGMRPWIAVRNADTGQRLVFRASLVARRGAHDADFEARVVFPTAGRWSYTIGDGRTAFKRHWVTVDERSDSSVGELSAGGVVVLILAGGALIARRRRRRI